MPKSIMKITKAELILFILYGSIFLFFSLFVFPLITKDSLRIDKQKIYKMLDTITLSTFLQNFTGQQVREIKVFEKDSYFTATFELYPIIRRGSILFDDPSVIVQIYREKFRTRDALDSVLLSYPFYCMFEESKNNPSITFYNCHPGSETERFSPSIKNAQDAILEFYEKRKNLAPLQDVPRMIPLIFGTLLAIFGALFYLINLLRFRGVMGYFLNGVLYVVSILGGSYILAILIKALIDPSFIGPLEGMMVLVTFFTFFFYCVLNLVLVVITIYLWKRKIGSLSSRDGIIITVICLIIAAYLFLTPFLISFARIARQGFP